MSWVSLNGHLNNPKQFPQVFAINFEAKSFEVEISETTQENLDEMEEASSNLTKGLGFDLCPEHVVVLNILKESLVAYMIIHGSRD